MVYRLLDWSMVGRDAPILPGIIFRKIGSKSKEQNAGIIGANLSKIHLVSYNSYA